MPTETGRPVPQPKKFPSLSAVQQPSWGFKDTAHAWCKDCTWESDRNTMRIAANHAHDTGHRVELEVSRRLGWNEPGPEHSGHPFRLRVIR